MMTMLHADLVRLAHLALGLCRAFILVAVVCVSPAPRCPRPGPKG